MLLKSHTLKTHDIIMASICWQIENHTRGNQFYRATLC